MRDDSTLLTLRPEIPGIVSEDSTPAEQFQNKTLRPILKYQHDLLVHLFSDMPHMNTLRAQSKTQEEFKSAFIHSLKQQHDIKNQIIGIVLGHFTSSEFQLYTEMKSEVNKRIIQMSGERIAGAIWK